MTGPTPADPPPGAAVVEWGTDRPGLLDRLAGGRWWHPGIPWLFAGLGGLALFGSLVGEWQVWHYDNAEQLPPTEPETVPLGLGVVLVWGLQWLVGAMLLAVCTLLALLGRPPLRGHARTVGLIGAGVQLGLLVGAAASLRREHLFAIGNSEIELSLGRGVYAAFACVLLLAAALYLARIRPVRAARRPAESPPDHAGPADLKVGPAEPLGFQGDATAV